MSSQKMALDGLRIDRTASGSAGARSGRGSGGGGWAVRILILAALGAGIYGWMNRTRPVPVRTVEAREISTGGSGTTGGGRTLLNASGYVSARREATVSSKVTGKVMEVLVEEGMKVTAGQVLARLDDSNVKAGMRLAEAQLDSARKILEENGPNLAFAEQERDRFAGLAASKAASQSDIFRAETEVRALKARIVRQTADVQVAEREVEQWQQQLDDMLIRAPFDGMVTTKNSQPGEMISPMSAGGFTRTGICTMVDMTSLEIDVDVNESFINRVRPAQPVTATLDAYQDWKIPCKVIAIIPTANRQKATVKVRVGFDQLDPRILPEMGVKVAFQSSEPVQKPSPAKEKQRAILVPESAVLNPGGSAAVWVVKSGKAERRAVTVSGAANGETTVAGGLSAGEKVIIQPPAGLADGITVTEEKP
ncbi:MAG: efflux RND transporter periplasmic adaptor subunit [Verrucomicrobiaceae bacterium]|nr:MAG: efflux RND transporter periplasmic adaptor subunit [Verrucomicrobiaceae bacterium]